MRIKGVAALSLLVFTLVGAVIDAQPAGAATAYRRWTAGKTYTCNQNSSDVSVSFSNQNVEFAGLSSGDQYTSNYIKDGSYLTNGPYDVEQFSGTKAYGAFSDYAPAFPFTYQFRIDTLINGSVVYTSELKVTCTAPGSGTVTPINTSLSTDVYRRWSGSKSVTCATSGSAKTVRFDNQDVEFNGLPTGALYRIHYIKNGEDTTEGAFAIERQNGKEAYGAFQTTVPSSPYSFEYRLDTLIGGTVTYTSKFVVTCGTNGTTTVAPIHANVTPAPFASWPAFVNRQYMDLTENPPSSAALSIWVSRLSSGASTKGELIEAIRRGTDNAQNVDPMVRLYRAFLQRTPDASGLRFWIDRRRTGTWTLTRISQSFATSNEFRTKYGALSNRQFVTRIYTDVLGRTADPSGVTYWTNQLDTGRRNRGTVMVGFSESNEYQRKQAENTDAAVANIFLLGRTPTLLTFNNWVSRQKAGISQAELAKELLTSEAYANRITG